MTTPPGSIHIIRDDIVPSARLATFIAALRLAQALDEEPNPDVDELERLKNDLTDKAVAWARRIREVKKRIDASIDDLHKEAGMNTADLQTKALGELYDIASKGDPHV